MDSIALLQQQIQTTREVMEGTVADLTSEQAGHDPGGTAMRAGVLYAHSVLGEDFFVNMIIQGRQPLMMTSFAGKSGISEPPPMGQEHMGDWAKRVQIDLPLVREYAQAVYQSTNEYLASLKPEDLAREIEMQTLGKQSLAWVLSMIAVVHPSNHCGEISCLKGIQGAKGYPF